MDGGENEKPFPCKVDGCKLSFSTEDHLHVHTKKHDMVLNLELPDKNAIFADQTPTPTRLIRNCEEVGLFEDLQNVNPFEETFRRAVEAKSTVISVIDTHPTLIGGILSNDDALHTPHIFPQYTTSRLEVSSRSSELKRKLTKLNIANVEIQKPAKITFKRKLESKIVEKSHINILPKPVSQPAVVIVPYVQNNEIHKFEVIEDIPVKDKLKNLILNNKVNGKNIENKITNKDKRVKMKIKSSVDGDKIEDSNKMEKHERWKAAAKRYRTKVKHAQDSVHQKNLELKEENLKLKQEIEKLKKALSLHKDCPLTKAMNSGVSIPIGLPKIVVNQTVTPIVHRTLGAAPKTKIIAENKTTFQQGSNPVFILINNKDFAKQ